MSEKLRFLAILISCVVAISQNDIERGISDKFSGHVIGNEYTVLHFEWNEPDQWITTNDSDIIACTVSIPDLCIYVLPNAPGFQLFYGETMVDFMNDDQWDSINVIHIENEGEVDRNDIGVSNNKRHFNSQKRRLFARNKGHGIPDDAGEDWARDKLESEKRRKQERRDRKLARNAQLGSGGYGCFNALCTTVLGPPRIIAPPTPPKRRSRCSSCSHHHHHSNPYPSFMYVPMSPAAQHHSMGMGMGMGMHPGMGMGMGMGMHPGMMGMNPMMMGGHGM